MWENWKIASPYTHHESNEFIYNVESCRRRIISCGILLCDPYLDTLGSGSTPAGIPDFL